LRFLAIERFRRQLHVSLASFLNRQREQGLTVRDAVTRDTALRMRPVMMTASVAILGLVPMLLSSGVAAEAQRLLATAVVGGLITSTLLTLVLLPVLYDWLRERAERKRADGQGSRAGNTGKVSPANWRGSRKSAH
jgi:cobalt-zinc-cadmium resistance protein CzcA